MELKTGCNPTRAVYSVDGKRFSTFVTYDEHLDREDDTRDVLTRYTEELRRCNERKVNMAPFDKDLLKAGKISKHKIEIYAEKIFDYYPVLFATRLASYIPENQPHLLKHLPQECKEYSIELRLHNLYYENDMSEALTLRQVRKLPPKERKKWHAEKCMYMEAEDCTRNNLVVAIDPVLLLKKLVRPIFLKQGKNYFDPFLDFSHDISHEWAHFLRLKPFQVMLQKERQFVKLPREVKRRDFYLEDIVRLAVEEGIANYSVYDEYAFHFSIDIIKKFNRKLKHLLRVSDPDAYISNSICIDTYEKDGAGFYYVGEAACYFISLLLQSKMNKKLINLEWCGHKVKPSEIPDILLRQRTRKNVPCLLFSSNRRQYVATFDHIIGLEPDEFFAELQEAQEMLKLKGENRIFVKEEFDALVGEARGISAKKT